MGDESRHTNAHDEEPAPAPSDAGKERTQEAANPARPHRASLSEAAELELGALEASLPPVKDTVDPVDSEQPGDPQASRTADSESSRRSEEPSDSAASP
jgi:hypothetical protein